jgi:hypothetical protein
VLFSEEDARQSNSSLTSASTSSTGGSCNLLPKSSPPDSSRPPTAVVAQMPVDGHVSDLPAPTTAVFAGFSGESVLGCQSPRGGIATTGSLTPRPSPTTSVRACASGPLPASSFVAQAANGASGGRCAPSKISKLVNEIERRGTAPGQRSADPSPARGPSPQRGQPQPQPQQSHAVPQPRWREGHANASAPRAMSATRVMPTSARQQAESTGTPRSASVHHSRPGAVQDPTAYPQQPVLGLSPLPNRTGGNATRSCPVEIRASPISTPMTSVRDRIRIFQKP